MAPKKTSAASRKRKPAKTSRTKSKGGTRGRHRKSSGMVRSAVDELRELDAQKAEKAGAEIASHLINYQKAALDSSIDAIGNVQRHTAEALHKVVKDAPWMPDEGKDIVDEWIRVAEAGRKEFKKSLDKSFRLLSKYLKEAEKRRGPKPRAKSSSRPRSRKRS